ncbi:MAG: acyl-CoA dehydrogenase family protein [Rhodobacteraceae bacterium]|nr:acyl-CoA dehydrogenase family protein [Paracoccaceae bacterium]
MSPLKPRTILETHEVMNQPTARGDGDLWTDDTILRHYATIFGADTGDLAAYGATMGREEMREAGQVANKVVPELRTFDRGGRRIDEVTFHPAYHRLMQAGMEAGFAARPWEDRKGGHATHAGMVYMQAEIEPGTSCPMTMTYASIPALKANPDIARDWVPRALSRRYDASSRPAGDKAGVTIGMAMTEKQGGSDVRANSTRATPEGDHYRLRGHKWFCSAPMCDAFLTLAQAPDGLTCFLVPRWTPDGERNPIQILRLKDKLGNRANASSEIEYHDAFAWRLGNEGDGVRTIVEMVHHTRLDTAMAPAGLMRAALDEAHWWISGRSAFQRRLIDQPLMRAVLADMVVELEASAAIGMRVAQAFDGTSPEDRAFARIAVATAKFLSNKRCVPFICEAMECLGGVGYVEESPMPLLYREAPLNSIWEGSGNVICLDIQRTLAREPLAGEVAMAELTAARGADRRYDAELAAFQDRWPNGAPEAEARWFAERLATLLQASILLRHAPEAIADTFMATRIARERGDIIGAIAKGDVSAIMARLSN